MAVSKVVQPVFSALSDAESRAVLRRNHVGRLAFLNKRQVDIEPVHYALGDGWIFVRSASGTKIDAFAHNPFVAFEIDEIEDTFDWRSVVARGTIYVLDPETDLVERREFERAVRALRRFLPATLTRHDPTPLRDTVYGIHIDILTGRMAESGKRRSQRKPLKKRAKKRLPRHPSGF